MPGDSGFSERLSPLLGMAVRCRMAARLWGMAALLALAVLVLAACQSTPSPYTGYLTEEIPPCTPAAGSSIDPCGPRPATMLVSQVWWLFTGLRIAFDIGEIETIEGNFHRDLTGVPPGMEQQLGAFGLNEPPFYDFVTHIIARATFLPGTERCTSNATFRRALYDEFLPPSTSSTWAAQCFADVRVNGYILGKGSPRLTVQTGLYIAIPEFLESMPKDIEGQQDITTEEFLEGFRNVMEYTIVHGDLEPYRETLTGGVRGKEVILFLGPSINHATEAWQVLETWDVKRKSDGTVVAVHPHREAWRMSRDYSSAVHVPLLEVELPRFKQEAAEASQARLAAYGGRIGADESLPMLVFDTNDLREFMVSAGSYEHPDGPPMPPLPVPGEDDPTPESTAVPAPIPPPTSPATDRDVLVAFYNAAGGRSWGNNWMSDRPIGEWQGVTTNTEGRVTYLDLSFNQLSGGIPPELGKLDGLKSLDLSGNQLNGEIPPELGNLANLQSLKLSGNQLNGEIPPELGNLANLEQMHLLANRLSGEIPPELGNLANLQSLKLSGNQLNEEIPSELGNLSNLEELELGINGLSGEMPPELGNLVKLEMLSLRYTRLSGEIPPELGNLANLQSLKLSGNQLSGEIPPELGNLANLKQLHLSDNQLGGEVPPELGNLANLEQMHLLANRLSGEIPPELGNLAKLQSLDLSSNQLSGEIPPELGNLYSLWELNLSSNQLSGEIPPEVGNLAEVSNFFNLGVLYLYDNQFSCVSAEMEPEAGQALADIFGLPVCGE